MADFRTAERARRLSIIIGAEREIAAHARHAYAQLLKAIAADVLNDVAIVAALRDPNRGRGQAHVLWAKLSKNISAVIGRLFKSRFRGTGAPEKALASREATFLTRVEARLADVSDELYADLNAIVNDGVKAHLTETEIKDLLRVELTPGHPEYERRLDNVSNTIGRTTATAAFNAGDQEGFVAISEHDKVPMATKSWLSSHDTKVRATHSEADGDPRNQDIRADAYFTVGGFHALYPGAADLPAHEAVNCRCTALYRDNGTLVASAMTEGAAMTTPETLPDGWRGPIAALDVPTSDSRMLATPPDGKIKTRAYPLTLTRNHVGDPTGYPTIGSVDSVWMQDGELWGEGRFDLGGADGQDAARQLAGGFINRMSIDPVEVVSELRYHDPVKNIWLSEEEYAELPDGSDGKPIEIDELAKKKGKVTPNLPNGRPVRENYTMVRTFTDWTLAGLAMVPIPAYTQAAVWPVFDYAPSQGVPSPAVVASVGGQVFNAAFFGDPKLTEYTPPTIDENGHFYGHVREHGTCYQYGGGAGNGGFCLEPPDSACGYAKFEQHGAKLDDGRTIRVGAVTFGDGHNSQGSLRATQQHYNDVATICAKVNAGTDDFGVWVNGQVTTEYEDKAYDLLLSPMSGHWEPDSDHPQAHLEMCAVHIVVTPGYRTRRIVAGFDDAGKPNSLIITTYPKPITQEATPVTAPRPRAAVIAAMNDMKRAQELQNRILAGTERAIVAAGGSAHIAATSTPWNGPAAAASILGHATKNGKIDVGVASQGFLAHINDGSKRGDWKLPYARVTGGVFEVIPRGVSAAAGRLDQTQGIDRAAAGSKICGLYARIRKMDPTWPQCPVGK